MIVIDNLPQELLVVMALLPQDRPFTTAEAQALGVASNVRTQLVEKGLLRRELRGVYWPPAVLDTLENRLASLRLVVPDDYVVTDRTAAWLWGAEMVLPPGAHLQVPKITVFAPPGRRLRNGFSDSGERRFSPDDIAELDGVRVTTPLRTACDVARLLHRDQALGVLDMLARAELVTVEDLVVEIARFKRYRGIIQARALVTLVDPGAESPMESVLRLRWYDAGLPRPDCQVPVASPVGGFYDVDVGLPDDRFGAEYFGEEFHGEVESPHDEERLDWITSHEAWTVVVTRRNNVVGPRQDVVPMLNHAWRSLTRLK